MVTMLLSAFGSYAQKNNKTETVQISGNCGMCEATIEKAGNSGKEATVDWNRETKMATISFDASKTSKDAILKRIALAGYDNELFFAPDDVYAGLPACCKYDRVNMESKMDGMDKNSTMEDQSNHTMEMSSEMPKTQEEDHSNHSHGTEAVKATQIEASSPFSEIYTHYFTLKDALVKSDVTTAATIAQNLVNAINTIKMEKLSTDAHTVWMEVVANLKTDAAQIAGTKDVEKQRKSFVSLSTNMYRIMKASSPGTTVYYQNCPMYNNGKGANWLSKESGIKNPYLGSSMLTCGKTVETIK